MANETNEKDIFFGKPGQERELTDPVPAPPKPAPAPAATGKEELARQIAMNMAMNDTDDDEDISFASVIPEVKEMQPQMSSRSSNTHNGSSRSASSASRSSSSSAHRSPAKKKKKKKSHAVDIVCGFMAVAIIGGVVGAYFYGKKAYDGVFLANTTINNIDVSKLTPDEATQKLGGQIKFNDTLSITKRDGTKITIDLKELDFSSNIAAAVGQAYDKQDHNMWFKSLMGNESNFEFDPDSKFNDTKLNAMIKKNVIEAKNVVESKNAYIERTDDGFELIKEVVGDSFDQDKVGDVYDYISDELAKGNFDISIADLDVYEKPSILASDLQEQYDSLADIANIEIKFDFIYQTEVLKGSEFIDWLDFNDDGSYEVDQAEVKKYVAGLVEKYDTVHKARKFKSTNRGTITVEPGSKSNYGWLLDDGLNNPDEVGGMQKLVTDLIKEGKSQTADPIWYTNGSFTYMGNPDCWTAKDDIGDTYLEVDLSAQTMWYYENGKKKREMLIVSGVPNENRNTPEGVFKLFMQAKNHRLKDSNPDGSSWDTIVAYWNQLTFDGIGIHDATWQPYFGGELYKWNGSHGCINVSLADAEYVYENVPTNTPVVAYWS
ncbi:MAG: L,D-transpeptidase family protein [Ruminococcus sp.]|nr:L,D-transpeptidase family protein [Ruminococcus sp.]